MAQSVEHHLGKVEVPGSNPGNSSKRKTTVSVVFNVDFAKLWALQRFKDGFLLIFNERARFGIL